MLMTHKAGFVVTTWLLIAGVSVAQETTGTLVALDGLSSRAPAEWKPVAGRGAARHAEFALPAVEGDLANAELIVFYFGPGGGGGAEANIVRWKGMFKEPTLATEAFTLGSAKVTYVDIMGTYLIRTRPFDASETPQPQANTRMLAVVFETANGPYYIRLVGPETTVAHHKTAFDQWLKNFKPGSR
jgi:hypothetical protein